MASHQRCSVKKGAILNLANFIKKYSLAQMFSCEFWEISKNTLFIEHLQTTVSTNSGTFFELQKCKVLSEV